MGGILGHDGVLCGQSDELECQLQCEQLWRIPKEGAALSCSMSQTGWRGRKRERGSGTIQIPSTNPPWPHSLPHREGPEAGDSLPPQKVPGEGWQ